MYSSRTLNYQSGHKGQIKPFDGARKESVWEARRAGGRVTDTFHVVDSPLYADDSFSPCFFVSCIRHTADCEDVLATLPALWTLFQIGYVRGSDLADNITIVTQGISPDVPAHA